MLEEREVFALEADDLALEETELPTPETWEVLAAEEAEVLFPDVVEAERLEGDREPLNGSKNSPASKAKKPPPLVRGNRLTEVRLYHQL